jgi:hypothetical protein
MGRRLIGVGKPITLYWKKDTMFLKNKSNREGNNGSAARHRTIVKSRMIGSKTNSGNGVYKQE